MIVWLDTLDDKNNKKNKAFAELQDLFDKHIHKQSERRFIVEKDKEILGLVELVEIDLIHRNTEFQIIIDPQAEGKGYGYTATILAMRYAFHILNLHKLYLIVDKQNKKTIHIYKRTGFQVEGMIIGGGVSKAENILLVPIKEQFKRFAVPWVAQVTDIAIVSLSNDAGVIGGAWLAQKNNV
ncbi:GNAT family N-acetyltransferase [Peribacillus sp. NPDC058002]|uniref:GNAT family N-acetyltransferase n=1 Tax=Peribacillus sp. NPDC058002 TaxID=3346301 RepID=UPI0036DAFAF8